MAAALRALLVLVGIPQAKHNPPSGKSLNATVLRQMAENVLLRGLPA
jgi:hypothetical protein